MKVTVLDRKRGEYVEMNNIVGIMVGVKWYWIEYTDKSQGKLSTDEYLLIDVEA